MTDHKLDQLLNQVSEPDPANGHIDALVLAEYADQDLEDQEMEAVRDHLAICNACTDSLLALNQDLGFDPQPSDPPIRAQSWNEIVAAAGQKPAETSSSHDGLGSGRIAKFLRFPVLLPWSVATACLVLAGWAWLSRGGPHAITSQNFVDLSQNQPVRGESTVFPDTAGKNLTFIIPYQGTSDPERWVLKRFDDKAILMRGPAERLPSGMLLFAIEGLRPPAGDYQIDLLGQTGDESKPLATYRFTLAD